MPQPTARPTARPLTVALATAALATTGIALTGGPSTAATADTTPGYSVTALTVPVKVGPNNDQACTVDADLYLPDGASASNKVPAVLSTHGFGGDKADDNQTAIGKGFVGQGYAVLSYSGLGFGKTTCKITLDDPDYDGKAGKQMVDVLAGTRAYTPAGSSTPQYLRSIATQKAGDPRVGMIGGSYGGQIQYAVAKQDPRVDAIIPIITWNDLSYSLAPGNVAKKEWIDLFSAAGVASGAENAPADPDTLVGCPNFTDQACVGITNLNTVGYPDAGTVALAKHASVSSYVKQVKAPTLLVQGQKDTLFNLNEAAATYDALKAQGTPVKMVWQSWGHSGSTPVPGELDFGAKSLRDSYPRQPLPGLDEPLRPRHEHRLDRSAVLLLPRLGALRHRPVQGRHGHREGLRHAQHLLPDSRRTRSTSPATTRSRRRSPRSRPAPPPTPTPARRPRRTPRPPGLEGDTVNNPPSDAPGTFAAFTSPVLTAPAEVVGSPVVNLHLSAPAAAATQAGGPSGQLVLFAKVYDVAPDGTKVLKNRLISPLRVTDVTKPVTLHLPGIVHRFATGHRIQVAVAASDFAYAGNTAPQPVTITTSPLAPSTLALPLTSTLAF